MTMDFIIAHVTITFWSDSDSRNGLLSFAGSRMRSLATDSILSSRFRIQPLLQLVAVPPQTHLICQSRIGPLKLKLTRSYSFSLTMSIAPLTGALSGGSINLWNRLENTCSLVTFGLPQKIHLVVFLCLAIPSSFSFRLIALFMLRLPHDGPAGPI